MPRQLTVVHLGKPTQLSTKDKSEKDWQSTRSAQTPEGAEQNEGARPHRELRMRAGLSCQQGALKSRPPCARLREWSEGRGGPQRPGKNVLEAPHRAEGGSKGRYPALITQHLNLPHSLHNRRFKLVYYFTHLIFKLHSLYARPTQAMAPASLPLAPGFRPRHRAPSPPDAISVTCSFWKKPRGLP